MSLTLSSYDLYHLVKELQASVGGKIDKIFQQEKPREEFLVSLHVPGKGKQYIYILLPGIICSSDFKPSFPSSPPAFCSSLRRKITGAKLVSIEQFEFQRIIVLGLESKMGKSKLIIELFSTGNIILVDEENTILAVLHRKIWNEQRKILHKETYSFPSQQFSILSASREDLKELLLKSDKDSIVTSLAIQASLGGYYAELILANSSLDKSILPSEAANHIDILYDQIQFLLQQETQAHRVGEKVYPIPVNKGVIFESLSKAISSIVFDNLQEVEEEQQTKQKRESLSKFQKVVKSQSSQRDGLLKSAQQNQEAGELIYKHYVALNEVLLYVSSTKDSWDEIKEKLKKYDFIVKVDNHQGEIQVELE